MQGSEQLEEDGSKLKLHAEDTAASSSAHKIGCPPGVPGTQGRRACLAAPRSGWRSCRTPSWPSPAARASRCQWWPRSPPVGSSTCGCDGCLASHVAFAADARLRTGTSRECNLHMTRMHSCITWWQLLSAYVILATGWPEGAKWGAHICGAFCRSGRFLCCGCLSHHGSEAPPLPAVGSTGCWPCCACSPAGCRSGTTNAGAATGKSAAADGRHSRCLSRLILPTTCSAVCMPH